MAVLFTLFALAPIFGADKTITFKTDYKKGQVFRYGYKGVTVTNLGKGKKQTSKIEMVLAYHILAGFGQKGLAKIRFEKFKMTPATSKIPVRKINRALGQVKFVVGPGLQVLQVVGLEKLLNPLLAKIPNQFVKGLVTRALRIATGLVNKNISGANKMGTKIFKGTRKEGEKAAARNKMSILMSTSAHYHFTKIETGKDGLKKAHVAVRGINKYGPLFQLLGYRTVNMKGIMVINEKTVMEKFTFRTVQRINPLQVLSFLQKRGGVSLPKGMTIVTEAEMVLLPALVKSPKPSKKVVKPTK